MTDSAVRDRHLSLRRIIDEGLVRSHYQPIVDLETGATIGYEALARGPLGTPMESPGALFHAAARLRLEGELDRACARAAVEGAVAAGLQAPSALFVNVEPAHLDPERPPLPEERSGLRIVVEFTEREVAARPAEMIEIVRWLRARGYEVALDDVGADRRSLALLPFLSPDVIKLDMHLVRQRSPTPEAARVLNAVGAEAERCGAAIVAEGIETEADLTRARAMGASLGQGYLFARPSELASVEGVPLGAPGFRAQPISDDGATPFEIVAADGELRRGDKRLLLALSRQLEAEAASLGGECVVLSTLQDRRFFTGLTRERYADLTNHAALVGILGMDVPSEPVPGVRGADLGSDDPLRGEWDVIVLSPHFSGAFVARDLGDSGRDADRRFDFRVTYRRDLVVAAATSLMRRIVPSGLTPDR